VSNDLYRAVFFTLRSNPDLAEDVFRFRTRLFVQELGWSLPTEKGVERDQFDTDNATYCALFHDAEVVGCFRAIRCDFPYLANTVFPHLATVKTYPTSPDALEISRLGVYPGHHAASALLYSLMVRFAFSRNVKRLVAIAELSHERLLNKIGLTTVRYGKINIVGFKDDGTWILAVAGEIPLPHEQSSRIRRFLQLSQQMDIVDETHVFGCERLSA
jgi:N-acyl-L-homoserine lactone synthetase